MKRDIEIQTDADWQKLRAENMSVIVDPMIVRSADLWLRGRSGQTDEKAPEVWAALDKNIDSLEAFFDAFIFSERLPLVDYGTTYDSNIGFEPESLYRRVNEAAGPVLRNVHVFGPASESARQESLNQLKAGRPAEIEAALLQSVKEEFSAFDHQWRPDLQDLGPLSADQQLVARFQYGLVLFAHFSAKAEVGHVMQSKRARMFVSAAMQAPSAAYELDGELRRRLKAVLESEEQKAGLMLDFPVCPPLFRYLLSKQPRNTGELFREAVKLRGQPEIANYRRWRSEIVSRWHGYAQIGHETEAAFREALRGVLRELGVDAPDPKDPSGIELGLNFLFMSLTSPVEKLFGWIPGAGAGKRHVKLLMRSMRASHEQKNLTTAVQSLWSRS